MIAVSPETCKRVQALFPPAEQGRVIDLLLRECGDNLPLVDTAYAQLAERIRFAVLRLSKGDRAELEKWVGRAKTDWRDVLLAAGFASGSEDHLQWHPD